MLPDNGNAPLWVQIGLGLSLTPLEPLFWHKEEWVPPLPCVHHSATSLTYEHLTLHCNRHKNGVEKIVLRNFWENRLQWVDNFLNWLYEFHFIGIPPQYSCYSTFPTLENDNHTSEGKITFSQIQSLLVESHVQSEKLRSLTKPWMKTTIEAACIHYWKNSTIQIYRNGIMLQTQNTFQLHTSPMHLWHFAVNHQAHTNSQHDCKILGAATICHKGHVNPNAEETNLHEDTECWK